MSSAPSGGPEPAGGPEPDAGPTAGVGLPEAGLAGIESSLVDPATVDLVLVDEIERAAIAGWPPSHVQDLPDGWTLRATPGLDRGRSCHALTPRLRPLDDGELPFALERVRAWSAVHGIRGGLQVSPLELHGHIVPRLIATGWAPMWKCWVMAADRADVLERGAALNAASAPDGSQPWICARRPDVEWLARWEAREPRLSREVIEIHAATVLARIGERGVFGALGDSATGIAVEDEVGVWTGLFALVVGPEQRRRGLGRRLVLSLLEAVSTPRVYLQVTQDNAVALRLYESLGFRAVYSYEHVQAPHGWAVAS